MLSLIGAVGFFAFSLVAIPSTFLATPVQAIAVTTGACTADVDNATGVTMTVAPGGDCVLSFTRTGTTTWTVPVAVSTVRALVVGGGGAGGKSTNVGGSGGGGAGAMVVHSAFSVTGSISVVVGAGAAQTTTFDRGANGSSSSLGTLVAIGGGGGGDWCDWGCQSSLSSRPQIPGANGGSGGGSGGGLDNSLGGNVAAQTLPAGATSYGNRGGNTANGWNFHGAGGGGAGAAGQDRLSASDLPTAGGIGLASDITGVNVVYAAGGGGSGGSTTDFAVGGSSIGGNGSGNNSNPVATNGVANTGSGGGGAQNGSGGGGGSGIVIVRYSIPAAPSISTIPTITGTARTGETLSSSTGTWSGSPTSYSYQWKRSLTSGGSYTDLAAATSSSYVVSDSDVGYFIKASVTATNGLGTSSPALSTATTVVVDIAPTNTVLPVITGTARTGATLTTTNGSWTSSPSLYVYQWKRATTSTGVYTDLASATNSTYVLTDTDIDKFFKVSVTATNIIGASSAVLSAATSVVVDLTDSVVPTATTPVSTATGFTFTISNYSSSYTYALTTTKGSVSRSTGDVTVTGLTAGESATVTISVTRSAYKSASKTVAGSASPAVTTTTTTTTAAPALSIVIQAPVTTVAQGQASVATVAPTTTTTTVVVLGANGLPVPTTTTTSTTTIAPARPRTVVTTTLPAIVTTTTVGPPVVGKVAAGQTAVQVDGVTTDAVVTRENNQMVVTAGSLSAKMSSVDNAGNVLPLDSDGNIHLSGGDVIKLSVGGFDPGSTVEVWLFSTPIKLGSLIVGKDGTINGLFAVPAGIKSGSHRVVISAKLANGKPTTFTLGILVGKISATSTLTRVLIAIPISLAIGFGFLLPTQLRRRRKARPA